MAEKMIVTIGREYGSGGKYIGQKLAEKMGVPFYDKELLTEAAKATGISEEMFATHDEKPVNSFLYSLVAGPYGGESLPMNHKLFLAQFEVIKNIAAKGPCVIIGRCADYALENFDNVIHVFIHADLETRVKRAIEEYGVTDKKPEDYVLKMDKRRASYYNFYSGKKWGVADSYHLSIDSSQVGIDNAVQLILDFIEMKQKFSR